jgi:uncharacterized protein YjbI with pentapeptide repeats
MKQICSDKTFNQADTEKAVFQRSEVENCTFNHCDLSNSDFSDVIFITITII